MLTASTWRILQPMLCPCREQETQHSIALKAHLSDPDIESKVDQELSPLLNGAAKSEGQPQTKPGMFQDMLGSPMLRCVAVYGFLCYVHAGCRDCPNEQQEC